MNHLLPTRLARFPTSHMMCLWRSSSSSSSSLCIGSRGNSIVCLSYSKTIGGNASEWTTYTGIRSSSSSSSTSDNKSRRPHTHQKQRQEPRGKYLDMRECHSIEEVCDMAYPRLGELNPRNLSSFWTKVSQLVSSSSVSSKNPNPRAEPFITDGQKQLHQQKLKERMESILIKTTDSLMTFEPRDLTQTALGIAKITKQVADHYPNGTTTNSFRSGVGQLGLYREILHDIFIGQKSDHPRKEIIFQSIADASISNLWYFEPRFLSNLAYANAIAGSVPAVASKVDDGTTTTIFDRIAEASIPLLSNFNPQDLSNMVWAYEKVGASTYPLFDEVSNSILARDDLDNFPPQALSNILLAFAKANESNKNGATNKNSNNHKLLFEKVADHIITAYEGASMDEFTPQALANILWAYATVHEPSPTLFDAVANHIIHFHHLKQFKAQELSNIVWAYASTSNRQPLLFSKVADHILSLDNLHSFNAQNCSNILWAYSTANITHQELFEKIAAHVMRHIDFKSLDEKTQRELLRASEKAHRVARGKNALGGRE